MSINRNPWQVWPELNACFFEALSFLLADEWDFLLLLNIGSPLEHNLPENMNFACFVSLLYPQNISQHVPHIQ